MCLDDVSRLSPPLSALYVADALRMLQPESGRLIFTHSRWGDVVGQLKTLAASGFTCRVRGSLVLCCLRCRKEAL